MKQKNKLVSPFLKWVGGKRQLLKEIDSLLPKSYTQYYEPFVGGGALLFHLQPKKAIINDLNKELINVYRVIKNDLEGLIADLKKHKNESDYFYEIRAKDRQIDYKDYGDTQRASRIIYLNKTCYNGLYRVNNAGEFNAPFGRYKNPNIVNEITLRAVSKYLNNNEVTILDQDYTSIFTDVSAKSFAYFDPPYHPVSKSSSFTGYVKGGFTEADQIKLKEFCDMLSGKKVNFLLSNSAAPFILDLYKDYDVHIVKATRAINSVGNKRGNVEEVLIRNYE